LPLPQVAPTSIVLDLVNLDLTEEVQQLTFSVNGPALPMLTAPPWNLTVDIPAGGIFNVRAQGRTDRRLRVDQRCSP